MKDKETMNRCIHQILNFEKVFGSFVLNIVESHTSMKVNI